MEIIKATLSLSQEIAKATKRKVHKNGGKSITQPDMALGIAKLLERSRIGMEVKGFEPIYYNDKNKPLLGFENLDKIEKIEFVRRFKAYAQNELDTLKAQKEQADRESAAALLQAQIEAKATELNNISQQKL